MKALATGRIDVVGNSKNPAVKVLHIDNNNIMPMKASTLFFVRHDDDIG